MWKVWKVLEKPWKSNRALNADFPTAQSGLSVTSNLTTPYSDACLGGPTSNTRSHRPWLWSSENLGRDPSCRWGLRRCQADVVFVPVLTCVAHVESKDYVYPDPRSIWGGTHHNQFPTSSTIILTVERRSLANRFLTLSTFSGVGVVVGLPVRLASSTVSRPSRKRLNHS